MRTGIKFVHSSPSSEILGNGFLKIKANICKEGVYAFEGKELGVDKDLINVWYPYKEFANSKFFNDLKSVPVIEGHKEVNVDNSNEIVGHVIGDPILEDGGVFVDLLIESKDAIDKIQKKEIQDVSLFFKAKNIPDEGEFEGRNFDYKIKDVSLEHIALLPPGEGRMGKEVRVFNKRSNLEMEAKGDMEKTVSDLKDQIEKMKADYEALKTENLELSNKASDAVLEKKLAEASEDNKKAEALDAVTEQKIANSGLHGSKLHKAALNSLGIDTQNMNDGDLRTAFETATIMVQKMSDKLKKTVGSEDRIFSNRKSIIVDDRNYNLLSDDEYDREITSQFKRETQSEK